MWKGLKSNLHLKAGIKKKKFEDLNASNAESDAESVSVMLSVPRFVR